jgi:hypothetical protein
MAIRSCSFRETVAAARRNQPLLKRSKALPKQELPESKITSRSKKQRWLQWMLAVSLHRKSSELFWQFHSWLLRFNRRTPAAIDGTKTPRSAIICTVLEPDGAPLNVTYRIANNCRCTLGGRQTCCYGFMKRQCKARNCDIRYISFRN